MALLDRMGLMRHPGTLLPGATGPYLAGITHIALEGLKAVPHNVYLLAHLPAMFRLDGFPVLTIFRDPRNVVLSYIAHRKREGKTYGFPQALEDYWGQPFVDVYRSYLGWHGRAAVFQYENLPPDVVGDGNGIYRNHDTDWNTRTGRPSRWQDVWDETIERAWAACGGNELLVEAGYG